MVKTLSPGHTIEFEVVGRPATQGSKVEQVIRDRNGKPIIRNDRALTTIREDNPRLPQWRQEVAHAGKTAYSGPLLIGAVELYLTFYRPRNKGDFRTGKRAGELKESAPDYPIKRPDTLKLARAVEDALTGVIWADDSQGVDHVLRKRFGRFGVVVKIVSVDGETQAAEAAGER